MEPITALLGSHQLETDWPRKDLFRELHLWLGNFGEEFKLHIPDVALRVDRLPVTRLGHFCPGRNGFGLSGEVALNVRYIKPDRFWRVLATLLHEMVHAWQHVHGHPSRRAHHNREFRAKLSSFGLVWSREGTEFPFPSPFWTLLQAHGVRIPISPDGTRGVADARGSAHGIAGTSKLKKWSCGCTNVRVAIVDFRAQCLKCGLVFTPASAAGTSTTIAVTSDSVHTARYPRC